MAEYNENAIAVYKRLYFDELQNESKPEQVHARVAKHIGKTPEEIEWFEQILNENIFRPNSPCLINAGRKSTKAHDKQLCACFVLGLEDTMESIIEMWGVCAKIYASGAGSGIPITNLREHKSPISTGGVASGPLRYLKVVDLLSDTVKSGGRSRRAANIGVFRYDHPESLDIVESKTNGSQSLKSFNLSMSVDETFMRKVLDPSGSSKAINIVSPNENQIVGTQNVDDIWNKVIKSAWESGDPGLFFLDTVNKYNAFPSLGKIDCANPCGEVPLPPWLVCNIGSINIVPFVRDSPGMADPNFKPYFNWDGFRDAVFKSAQFLDNVIDTTTYLHPKFETNCKILRPIGLGIMGFADACIKLNISYGSDESIHFFERLCFELTRNAIDASISMVEVGGRESIKIPERDVSHFIKLLKHYTKNDEEIIQRFMQHGIRNSTWTCIAPTGSISISCGCSYAWEPLMAVVWEKPLVDTNEVLKIVHEDFEHDLTKWISSNVHDSRVNQKEIERRKKIIMDKIVENHGSIQKLEELPEAMRRKYVVAHDIDPIKKIQMQAAGQRYISLAISSTCNLPNSATVADVDTIYREAYKMGLKGITIFRDGCKDSVVAFGKLKRKEDQKASFDRPIKRSGETVEIKTPYGKLFITCNFDKKKEPFEIFFRVGKQGALTNVLIDALGRVCSKALQGGIPMEIIIDTLRGLKVEKFWFKIADDMNKSESAESIVDAIAQLIEYHWEKKNKEVDEFMQSNLNDVNFDCISKTQFDECPICHRNTLRHDTGCRGGYCVVCGHSACE